MDGIPESWLKDTSFVKAAEAHTAVYEKLTPEKAHIMDQICLLFTDAYLSYSALNDKSKDPSNRIYLAGSLADIFLVRLRYISELLKLDEAATEQKLQVTSDWLEGRNWICIPKYYDIDGTFHQPTAHGVVFDMKANSGAMHSLLAASQETGPGSRTSRRKTTDDKSIVSESESFERHPRSFERRAAERMVNNA